MSMDTILLLISTLPSNVYCALLCFWECCLGLLSLPLSLPLSSSRDDSFASATTTTYATGNIRSSNDESDGLTCTCSGFRLWATTGLLIMVACGFYVTQVSSLRRGNSSSQASDVRGMGNRNPDTASLLSSTSGGNGRSRTSLSIDKRVSSATGLGSIFRIKSLTAGKGETLLFVSSRRVVYSRS